MNGAVLRPLFVATTLLAVGPPIVGYLSDRLTERAYAPGGFEATCLHAARAASPTCASALRAVCLRSCAARRTR